MTFGNLAEQQSQVQVAAHSDVQEYHAVNTLIGLFNGTFLKTFNTELVRGDDEPIYLPATQPDTTHKIVFAHGYFASALHEIAHWCLAGAERRKLEDYGYWYCPDGRDAEQQALFEQVEVKPQAIEWALTFGCARAFQVSTDNLNGVEPDRARFTRAVKKQLLHYLEVGFPPRAQQFMEVLQLHFHTQIGHLKRDLSNA